MAWLFAAPPDLPADREQAAAFDETMAARPC
jgi:hypothetical protein